MEIRAAVRAFGLQRLDAQSNEVRGWTQAEHTAWAGFCTEEKTWVARYCGWTAWTPEVDAVVERLISESTP